MGVPRWVAMALHIQGQVVGFGIQQVAVEKLLVEEAAGEANCIEPEELEMEKGMVAGDKVMGEKGMVMGDKVGETRMVVGGKVWEKVLIAEEVEEVLYKVVVEVEHEQDKEVAGVINKGKDEVMVRDEV